MKIGLVSYVNNLRVQYASELIGKGKHSLFEIAEACGYSDYSYFSRVFKKISGQTPSAAAKFIKTKG